MYSKNVGPSHLSLSSQRPSYSKGSVKAKILQLQGLPTRIKSSQASNILRFDLSIQACLTVNFIEHKLMQFHIEDESLCNCILLFTWLSSVNENKKIELKVKLIEKKKLHMDL